MATEFPDLTALFLNCSLKKKASESHTQRLLDRVARIMGDHGVAVEQLFLRDHTIAFGMVEDATKEEGEPDDWPAIQQKIVAADILVIGTPIWLSQKSSVATLAIERMYAYADETNDRNQPYYYGKVAGCVVTGNEDGVKHVDSDLLFTLEHMGLTIPPNAETGWIGEIGPGPSYGDDGIGLDNEYTNRTSKTMAWNLMSMASLIKAAGGIPAEPR